MMKALLIRGMIAGAIAGLTSLVFAYLFGEPSINGAIAFEERAQAAAGEHPVAELVSREVQSTLGLVTALVIYGVAIGGIFALVYATVYGRAMRLGPRGTAAVVALAAFLVGVVVPFLKYPANLPGANQSGTITERTTLYVTLVAISIASAVMAVILGHRLRARFGAWNATMLAGAFYIVVMGIVAFVLPSVNETPAAFPASLIWEFRLASLGNQAVLWTTVGLLFGWLAERASRREHMSVLLPSASTGQSLH